MASLIGTAGWAIPGSNASQFAGEGTHLERYARKMACVEINSSFYRPHQREVYQRWAASTPEAFRFAVKIPKAISHESKLRGAREPLKTFLAQAGGLEKKLAIVLVQLPPSLAFDSRVARTFFGVLSEMFDGAVICEPRHPSWFTDKAEKVLQSLRVGRAAADPARVPAAVHPGGWMGENNDGQGAVIYRRWHGSPRMYWSAYEPVWLSERANEQASWSAEATVWSIFDNTAGGCALTNAWAYRALLRSA